ncbi:DUF1853 family protein [Vibrio profundum]|uniref:DUF1853 family protein n=1 Tax=Vibrio profundum TaxID=2910247 RepID=UPI003D0EB65B
MTDFPRIAQWVQNTPSLFNALSPICHSAPTQTVAPRWPDSYTGNPRLGFLYQYVVSELFNHSQHHQILAEEVQLSDAGKTLGAIDFIIENLATTQLEHWEVAIKFYLLHDGKWYGPNAKDRLDLKLDRMLNHQLAMSASKSFRLRFPEWDDISQHLLMQGRLYVNPFEQYEIPTHCLGYEIEPSRVEGYWCYQSQKHLISEPILPLAKHLWITGFDKFDLNQEVSHPHREPLHYQAQSGKFWFVVPDSWPNN